MKDDDVIEIKSREELKALAEKNASPCARCLQAEGCPAPAYCGPYQAWRKARKKNYERVGPGILQRDGLAGDPADGDQQG